ncbi:hypothetical protein NIES2104_08440 [Leptolyngbya sp. NIES-2104]|nr:hypothetical protein NIES2104_08440 [Leptolyngbya sp. NIES-2104]
MKNRILYSINTLNPGNGTETSEFPRSSTKPHTRSTHLIPATGLKPDSKSVTFTRSDPINTLNPGNGTET